MATIKVKITGSVTAPPYSLGHFVGDVVELDADKAKAVIHAGRAVAIETAEADHSEVETATVTPKRKR